MLDLNGIEKAHFPLLRERERERERERCGYCDASLKKNLPFTFLLM